MHLDDLQKKLHTLEKLSSEQPIALADHGVDKVQAEILRASLMTFADDWNSPEMDLCDHYDVVRANLQAQ